MMLFSPLPQKALLMPLLASLITLVPMTARSEEPTVKKAGKSFVKYSLPSEVGARGAAVGVANGSLALDGNVVLENSVRRPVTYIDAQAGMTFLRIQGKHEGIPIQIEKIEVEKNKFELQILPLRALSALELATVEKGSQAHLVMTPSAAVAYGLDLDSLQLKARLRVGAALGMGVDRDAAGVIAGVNLGGDLEMKVKVLSDIDAYVKGSVDQVTSVFDSLNKSTTTCFEIGGTKDTRFGKLSGGIVSRSTQMDMMNDSELNKDSGSMDFTGLFVRLEH